MPGSTLTTSCRSNSRRETKERHDVATDERCHARLRAGIIFIVILSEVEGSKALII